MPSTVRLSQGRKRSAQHGSEKSRQHQRNICDSHPFSTSCVFEQVVSYDSSNATVMPNLIGHVLDIVFFCCALSIKIEMTRQVASLLSLLMA